MARVSCGIYAGPHKARINAEFVNLVDEILAEPFGAATRGHYFLQVVVTQVPPETGELLENCSLQ